MYVEQAPAPELAPWVERLWSIRTGPDAPTLPNRVLPDGCTDIILELGPASDARDGTGPGPRCYVVGTMTTAALHPLPPGAHLVGVRFRPGAARPLLDAPASELTGRVVDLAALWATDATRLLLDRVAEAAACAGDAAAPLRGVAAAVAAGRRAPHAALADELLRRARRAGPPDLLVAAASRRIAATRGGVQVGALAGALGVGRRRLERAFAEHVGVPPGSACATARFRAAAELLRSRADLSIAAVAVHAGYADQPHLTRAFRALGGITPAAFRSEARVASVQDAPDDGA